MLFTVLRDGGRKEVVPRREWCFPTEYCQVPLIKKSQVYTARLLSQMHEPVNPPVSLLHSVYVSLPITFCLSISLTLSLSSILYMSLFPITFCLSISLTLSLSSFLCLSQSQYPSFSNFLSLSYAFSGPPFDSIYLTPPPPFIFFSFLSISISASFVLFFFF